MRLNLQQHWYRSSRDGVALTLLPLSWLFRSVVGIRRFFYRTQFKKMHRLRAPVLIVGNITVGGTGKTPFVIWLAKLLKEHGYKPGIVSRGVGGKQQQTPRWVDKNADPQLVGDEAVLLARRSFCPVVIGVDRVACAKELLATTDCDIVISDDGLQHYRLARDVEIAIVDGTRGLGNQCFLPAGPLRESPKRLTEVDFVVEQVSSSCATSSRNVFPMYLEGEELVAVQDDSHSISLSHFQHQKIHAVAAIGNPERFFASLRTAGFQIVEHVFPDHYLYQEQDFHFDDDAPIVMTEKDAVKCQEFADQRFWYLPVSTKVSQDLVKNLLEHIQKIYREK